MPQIRRIIRERMVAALSDPSTGFNVKLGGIASDYGVDPFSIDFLPGSRNFFQGFVDTPEVLDQIQITEFPAMLVYTSASENRIDAMPTKFSGTVVQHVDVWARFDLTQPTSGRERDNTEPIGDAVEDAIVEAIYLFQGWGPATFGRQYRCDRGPLRILGDGWEQRYPFQFIFEVQQT